MGKCINHYVVHFKFMQCYILIIAKKVEKKDNGEEFGDVLGEPGNCIFIKGVIL